MFEHQKEQFVFHIVSAEEPERETLILGQEARRSLRHCRESADHDSRGRGSRRDVSIMIMNERPKE